MRYYKQISNSYILSIGTGMGGNEITEAEYSAIMATIRTHPLTEGKGYKLRCDLTWEEYDLPPATELPDNQSPEAIAVLNELADAYQDGVNSL